ncbi:MAG: hypothetical protein AAB036_08945 [Elusimicrobiota bacterium]
MNSVAEQLRNNELWTISVQLLILYVVTVALFLGAHAINQKVLASSKEAVSKGKASASALAFILFSAVNIMCVATLAYLARKTGETPRLAMVGVPLFLLLEKHVSAMRAVPEHRRFNMVAAAAVAAGALGGIFAFMPHAPFK